MAEKSIASGTIIDPDGTILTCAHVVCDFQSTKAVVRGKVINLPLSNLFLLSCTLRTGCVDTVNHWKHEIRFLNIIKQSFL
jgi:hypothetical protein